MILKRGALRIIWALLVCFTSPGVSAQPTLPNISGSADKGIVLLSWMCQFTGVKAIAVLHSTDSIYNFKIIGYVKKLDKGIQAYVDGHPDTGKNYYKLSIVFNSGLTWTSNRRLVYIDISKIGPSRLVLPRNDSLQRFIVTEELYKPEQVNVPKYEFKSDSDQVPAADKKVMTGHKVSLSFEADTTGANTGGNPADSAKPAVRKKITISFDEPNIAEDLFIRSMYIFTDSVTGHVRIALPDDVRKHHYSVKFFDKQNHVVLELPKINAAKIIIDKRNFQRKGVFKFVLRKDAVEFESGFINVAMRECVMGQCE